MTHWRDLALYILIALAIGAAAYLYAISVIPSSPVNSVWVGLCLNTMVVFGFVSEWGRANGDGRDVRVGLMDHGTRGLTMTAESWPSIDMSNSNGVPLRSVAAQ
jgi:hypothetical protein